MRKAITEQGNFIVLGSTGSGKTVFCAQRVQVFLSEPHSDSGHGVPANTQNNDNDSGEHHDRQG
jgi:adenylate kinase family enzyme